MQYIIKAYDGENMLERRLAVRAVIWKTWRRCPGRSSVPEGFWMTKAK